MSRMAPWDENAYFDLPVSKTLAVPPGGEIIVASANPNRVGIFFSCGAAGPIFVNPNAPALSTNGLAINAQTPILGLLQAQWGPYPAMEWHAGTAAAAQTITVIELILREWPKAGDSNVGTDVIPESIDSISANS